MNCLHGFIVVTLALLASSSALAQSADPDDTGSAARETPPGYGADRLPTTRAECELMRSALEQRVLSAERRLETVRARGDATEEAAFLSELGSRRQALRTFLDRTEKARPAMIGAGAVMTGLGLAGLAFAAIATFLHQTDTLVSGPESDRRENVRLGLAIGGAVFVWAGVPLIIVGAHRTWAGPPEASPTASVVVGPGRFALRGTF